jgi:hypothetical protein
MRTLNLYSFHKGIASERFDNHNTQNLIKELSKIYNIVHKEYSGNDNYYYKNDCNVLINQGSILIFEFDDTKEFKTFDFGDAPTISVKLSLSKNFIGAAIGQYNVDLWDQTIKDKNLRNKIKPSFYPESYWHFGLENYEDVYNYRKNISLNTDLYWRGSIYKDPNIVEYDRRIAIEYIANQLKDFHFGYHPISFDSYIKECINYKLALCFGVGGGYSCGDFCLRDIELYGLGIPTIRPKYAAKTEDPLIPDYHYIAVDCEFDETYRYKNPEKLASLVIQKYKEVIKDDNLLQNISTNARNWYLKNVTYPNITQNLIKILEL